jgi:hypothetical protein
MNCDSCPSKDLRCAWCILKIEDGCLFACDNFRAYHDRVKTRRVMNNVIV